MSVTAKAIKEGRVSQFVVARAVWENPVEYRLLLEHFLPVRVEAEFWRDRYVVTAYCDEFEPAHVGSETPWCMPLFRRYEDGRTEFQGFAV